MFLSIVCAEDVVNRVLRTVIAPRVAPGQDGDTDGTGGAWAGVAS